MTRPDFFTALRTVEDFHRLLEEEEAKTAPLQKPFGILRIEARGMARPGDLVALYRAVSGAVRHTDRVVAIGGTGLATLLQDADAARVDAVAHRVRAAASNGRGWRTQLGSASVRPGSSGGWQEAWRLAGALLVADGAVAAAA